MLEQMTGFFLSGFANPTGQGIFLAIIFGVFWLAYYWLPLIEKPWYWSVLIFMAVLVGSAILSWVAVAFVQIPLQVWAGQALGHFWSQETLVRWILLAAIPGILLSGLVQEGSKLVPVVIYWWRKGRRIDPKVGLAVGAVAGAGLGVFEAQWVHNMLFASGWSWEAVQTSGLTALLPFWERFFVVAFHTAACALAGWGLARGWGWQFYLLAALLHAIINYSVILLQAGVLTEVWGEVFIAVWAILVSGGVLWLRWRKADEVAEPEVSPAQSSEGESG